MVKKHDDRGVSDTDIIPILDERFSYEGPRRRSKLFKLIFAAGAVLLVGGGVATAVILTSSKSSNNASSSSAANKPPSPASDASSNKDSPSSSSSSSLAPTTIAAASTEPSASAPDPETDAAAITMLAIGDWGSTTGRGNDGSKPGSCCKLYSKGPNAGEVDTSKPRYLVDYHAQEYVAQLMGLSADALKPTPARILGHGDSIYWNGVGKDDIQFRMTNTFENIYTAKSLSGIKWLNVAGNHDIGGSQYICGDDNDHFRECTSIDEMLTYLDLKFTLQAKYKSPNGDRWQMKDHYYMERVTQNGVTVDILNLDTNNAGVHGADQVCCQCYGYRWKVTQDPAITTDPCKTATRGHVMCAGGSTDMYDKCMARIESWVQASYDGAAKDLAASTADWKIVNTHYSPHFHMTPAQMDKWYNLTETFKLHAWFNGHTHGFNHDIAKWNTHFFQNGAGGGIFSESSTMVATTDKVKTYDGGNCTTSGSPAGL
ncbi:Aste57867_2864 [Aphanomyces stellatus]|uniref:Aste57867_2864 protein n=1 Tax=Aphanomyces stellatus TaxID=120398 RepID=A0A485KA51_9STRA|nr:hypothetical protein As57867_002856 [Aphanomyces stellatus]VFT80051.1 Aste57867_2864 [Aphanomyces stellatus]